MKRVTDTQDIVCVVVIKQCKGHIGSMGKFLIEGHGAFYDSFRALNSEYSVERHGAFCMEYLLTLN